MSTLLRSVLFAIVLSVLSVFTTGCGVSAQDAAKAVIASGEQQNIDAAAERQGWPEWMLQSAVNKLCPTNYVLEPANKAGNSVPMCHNLNGNGVKPTPVATQSDGIGMFIALVLVSAAKRLRNHLSALLLLVVVAVALSGCGVSPQDAAKAVIASGEQELMDKKAEENNWPEWMLQSAVNKLCPTHYVLEPTGAAGNSVPMCHNRNGNGIEPTPQPTPVAKSDALPLVVLSLAQVVSFLVKAYYKGNQKYYGAAYECVRDFMGETLQRGLYESYTFEMLIDICAWANKYGIGATVSQCMVTNCLECEHFADCAKDNPCDACMKSSACCASCPALRARFVNARRNVLG